MFDNGMVLSQGGTKFWNILGGK